MITQPVPWLTSHLQVWPNFPYHKAPHCLSCPHWAWKTISPWRVFLLSLKQPVTCVSNLPTLFPPHISYERTCLQLRRNTAPFQSPALPNRQVKLLLSPFLPLCLFLSYRSERRTLEVKVFVSQDSNGQVGKRHREDSRTALGWRTAAAPGCWCLLAAWC